MYIEIKRTVDSIEFVDGISNLDSDVLDLTISRNSEILNSIIESYNKIALYVSHQCVLYTTNYTVNKLIYVFGSALWFLTHIKSWYKSADE